MIGAYEIMISSSVPPAGGREDLDLAVEPGVLPDAPLTMPAQIIEQPSRLGQYLRGLIQKSPGRAET